MLKRRRQSVDLGELRHEPKLRLPGHRSSVASMDYLTGTRWFTTRSPRTSSNTPPHSDTKSTYENDTDGMEHRKSVTETSSTRRKLTILREKIRRRSSRSSTPSSSDSRQSSSEHSGKFSLKKRFLRRSKSPDTKSDLPTTPTILTGKGRRSGVVAVAYEPQLSPVQGTPTHKAKTFIEEPDSGFGKMNTGPIDTTDTTETNETIIQNETEVLATPLSPKAKRNSVRRGTVTGVELSRLPLGKFQALQRHVSADDTGDRGFCVSHEEFTMSPSQLLRQLKRIRQPAKPKPKSSVFYARLESLPRINQSGSYRENEEDPVSLREISEDRSITISRDSSILSSRDYVSSITDQNMLSPATSTSQITSSFGSNSREEVDFPENSNEAKPVDSRKLIKTLDLSSNLLPGLQPLCDEQGSGLVFRRLAGLVKLDLHQNQLTSLPRELMQVQNISKSTWKYCMAS